MSEAPKIRTIRKRVDVPLDAETKKLWRRLAGARGVSMSELARAAVADLGGERRRERREAVEAVLARWATVRLDGRPFNRIRLAQQIADALGFEDVEICGPDNPPEPDRAEVDDDERRGGPP